MAFSGQIEIVTGATSGIGRAIARDLVGKGARLVVTGRNRERGADVVTRLSAQGGEAVCVVQDLADRQAPQAIVASPKPFPWGGSPGPRKSPRSPVSSSPRTQAS